MVSLQYVYFQYIARYSLLGKGFNQNGALVDIWCGFQPCNVCFWDGLKPDSLPNACNGCILDGLWLAYLFASWLIALVGWIPYTYG